MEGAAIAHSIKKGHAQSGEVHSITEGPSINDSPALLLAPEGECVSYMLYVILAVFKLKLVPSEFKLKLKLRPKLELKG